ncbi:hypothetical protein JCM8097_000829 [Rhodosporidiobolus ruineniae]
MASSSPHRLEQDPTAGTRSIHLHGWTVTATKRPILSIPEADQASADLDLALPEIIFGNNCLVLQHHPSGLEVKWDARGFLAEVKKGQGWDEKPGAGAVSVKHADEWKRGQAASTSATASLTVQKPFDWTYTTLHRGAYTLSPSSSPPSSASSTLSPSFSPAPPSHPGIPLAQLARTDIPILFFEEIPLFEDELGDNGIADVTVRVRVNHLSLYILARFSLRIDGVLFRHLDVRLFHAFGSPEIVRQTKGREAGYEEVRERILGTRSGGASPASGREGRGAGGGTYTPPTRIAVPNRSGFASSGAQSPISPPSSSSLSPSPSHLPAPPNGPAEDLSKLNDINLVASVLEQLALEGEMGGVSLAGQGGNGHGGGGWEGLGVRLEVMPLPDAGAGAGAKQ